MHPLTWTGPERRKKPDDRRGIARGGRRVADAWVRLRRGISTAPRTNGDLGPPKN